MLKLTPSICVRGWGGVLIKALVHGLEDWKLEPQNTGKHSVGVGAMCNCSLKTWRQGITGAGWPIRLALRDRTKVERNPKRLQASTSAFPCAHENMHTTHNTCTQEEWKAAEAPMCTTHLNCIEVLSKIACRHFIKIIPSYLSQECDLGYGNNLRCFLELVNLNIVLPTACDCFTGSTGQRK